MTQEKVKIQKGGQVKTINKKDLKDFVASGWQEIKTANATNPFANTQYGINNNILKK